MWALRVCWVRNRDWAAAEMLRWAATTVKYFMGRRFMPLTSNTGIYLYYIQG